MKNRIPSSSMPFSSTIRTDGRPSGVAVASAMRSASTMPGGGRLLEPLAERAEWVHIAIATYLIARYSSMPSGPPSRPKPEALTPPNGAAGLETMPWLRPTMPV